MRKIISLLASAFILIGMIPIFSYAEDNSDKSYEELSDILNGIYAGFVLDNNGILDGNTVSELNSLAEETAHSVGINIAVYIAGTNDYYRSDYDIERFADSTYDSTFGDNTDGVFFYMDISGRRPAYDYISTSGKAILFYQHNIDNHVIFDRIYAYLPPSDQQCTANDVENAVKEFLDCMEGYAAETDDFTSYYYDSKTDKYIYYKNGELQITSKRPLAAMFPVFLASIGIGFLVGIIVYFANKSKYKFKVSTNPSVYVSSEETKFLNRQDTFIRAHTTKTKIESSSSGGGGGGGGGGSHR